MAQHLFIKNGTYYFRRRIVGYPHKTRPLMVSLSCKDQSQALFLLQQIQAEYQKMLNSFIFIQPPLPEKLVRTYLAAALRSHVHKMQRNLRSARMTGRIGETDQLHADVYPVVLQSMLEHGVQKRLPPQAIDPHWSQKHLESALHIYDRERNAIMSSEGRVSLVRDFATATGTDRSVLNNLEHECQVREAHITAKLAAFEAVRSPQTDMLNACRDQAKKLLQCQKSETEQPKPDSTPQLLSPVNIPEKPRPKPSKVISPPPPVSVENLTTHMLRDMHDAAQNAGATSRANYSSGIADVYWRMAKTDAFSEDVAKQRASDLRLFGLVTGIAGKAQVKWYEFSEIDDARYQT